MTRPTNIGRAIPYLSSRLGGALDQPGGGEPSPDCCDVDPTLPDRGSTENGASAVGLSSPGTPTLVQSEAFGNGGESGAINGPHSLPSEPTVGNILVADLGIRAGDWDAAFYLGAWPSGWTTLVGNNFAGVDSQGHVLRAKVVASSADQSITFSQAITGSLILSEWSGFGGTLPTVDTSAVADVSADATPAVPAVTPTAAIKALFIASNWKKAANPNPGPQTLSGYTLIDDTEYDAFGNRHRLTSWYQYVDPTSGTYGPTDVSTSGDASDYSNIIHAVLAGGEDPAWVVPEPNVTDGDDDTYDTVTGTDLLRIDLGGAFRIVSTDVRIAANTSGARVLTIKGANAVDFSDEVTLGTISYTDAGGYVAQDLTGSWSNSTEYRYYELSSSVSDTYRVHAWELYEGSLATSHVHTLQSISDIDFTAYQDGYVLTATGSNSESAWRENVARITSNGSNTLASPYVSLLSGAGVAFSVASNALTISSTVTGGGAGSVSDYVSGASGTGQIIIPGLAGSPDIRVAGGSDDEFDTTDTSDPMTGWTTLGSPTSHNINSTVKSNYYITKAAGSLSLTGIYKSWSPSNGAIVTAKLTGYAAGDTNSQARGQLFIAVASPGKIISIGKGSGHNVIQTIWTNPTTFSSNPFTTSFVGSPLWMRIIYNSSTSVTYQFSFDGIAWWLASTADPSMTVGAVGLLVSPNSTTHTVAAAFDWIRFS